MGVKTVISMYQACLLALSSGSGMAFASLHVPICFLSLSLRKGIEQLGHGFFSCLFFDAKNEKTVLSYN